MSNDTNLYKYYQNTIAAQHFKSDPKQIAILPIFQSLYDTLNQNASYWPWQSRKKNLPSLYLWGSVGSGKTFLMDLFFTFVKNPRKLRQHFFAFMQNIHQALKKKQGTHNPLKKIASDMAKHYDLIALDEFFIEDIGDAMLIGPLLQTLFNEGVVMIFTSNTPPDQLYLQGLQRDRFLQAIAFIKKNSHVIELSSEYDYRHRETLSQTYYCPINADTNHAIEQHFLSVAKEPITRNSILKINERNIAYEANSDSIIWFTAAQILNIPRSTEDWLSIVTLKKILLVSHMPAIKPFQHNNARNFIHFIDIVYESHTQLILQTAVPLSALYPSGRFEKAMQRTLSRLHEMQTQRYQDHPS
jgi:cell division protein ZapE